MSARLLDFLRTTGKRICPMCGIAVLAGRTNTAELPPHFERAGSVTPRSAICWRTVRTELAT